MKLSRLNEMSEEGRIAFDASMSLLNSGVLGFKFVAPKEEFDSLNLRYDIDYLNKVGKLIVLLPVEEMVNYVDGITFQHILNKNKYFIDVEIPNSILNIDLENKYHYNSLNATSIGNIAYVMENCESEHVKKLCEDFLLKIVKKETDFYIQMVSSNSKMIEQEFSDSKDGNTNIVGEIIPTSYLDLIEMFKTCTDEEIHFISSIVKEYQRAKNVHPNWPSDVIHASAIVSEESGELVRASLQFVYENGKHEEMVKEAIQTSAMGLRFLVQLNKDSYAIVA